MTQSTPSIGRSMAKGAAWMIGMRFAMRAMGMVSTIILARLLVPEDFGLVALATMLWGLLEVMSDFSFDVALIKNQDAGRAHYDTAWTLQILRGAIVAGLLAALSGPSASFFEDPRVQPLVYCLALAAFVEGFQNIGVVNFRKDLEFHKEFRFLTAEKAASIVVAIALAVWLRNYWALIGGILTGKVVRIALSYLMQAYRPRPCLEEWREIFHFAKWLLANNMLFYFFNRADNLVVGKLLGAGSLGLYSMAYEISNLTTTELILPIRRALFPGYAKLAADRKSLRRHFLDTASLVFLVGAPAAAGVGLTADLFVPIFLGDKWLDVIPLIQILAAYGIIQTVSSGCGPVYLALGRPQYLTALAVSGMVIVIPLLLYAVSREGLLGGALAVTCTAAIIVSVDLTLASRLLGVTAGQIAGTLWRPVTSAVAMASVVYGLKLALPQDGGLSFVALKLAVCILAGATTYVGAQLLLWHASGKPSGAERHVLAELWEFGRSRLARIGRWRAPPPGAS